MGRGDRAMIRRAVLLAAPLLAIACGASDDDGTEQHVADPFDEVTRAQPDPDADQSAHPRWEKVTTLAGQGPDSIDLVIAEDALQWRADWSCIGSGDFVIDVTGHDEMARNLVDHKCPDTGDALSVDTGILQIDVQSTGDWELQIEQYVDTYLTEPPLPEMEAADAAVVAVGEFVDVERHGEGRALLYELPDGRLALRFEGFATQASPDLFLLVSAEEVSQSADLDPSSEVRIGPVISTLGDQNYELPDGVSVNDIRSVVIWCEPLQIAYTAAVLHRP
jgi:hypothetical protein